MLVKDPPAYTTPPPVAIVFTELSAPGFHAVANPLVTSSAARSLRDCPPIPVNVPPAYTTPLPSAMDCTSTPLGSSVELALGFHEVTSPLAGSSAAIPLRDCPPIPVKCPPAYTTPLPIARDRTLWS